MLAALCLLFAVLSTSGEATAQKSGAAFSYTTDTLRLDGVLDEDFWSKAAVFSDFRQFTPVLGASAAAPTSAYVIFGPEALYVGVKAVVPGGQDPRASITKRDDNLTNQDDSVTLLLDPLGTGTNAYIFSVNALGTQLDGRMTDNGRVQDVTWDAAWQSDTRKSRGIWVAEFSIPYKEIQYKAGLEQSWGINVTRNFPPKLETSFWRVPADPTSLVSAFGTIQGVALGRPPWSLDIIPYGLLETAKGTKPTQEWGGDMRFAPSPQWFLNATLNPDFATVEADQEQINLTRFELDLPEKRPFFLEDAEQFKQRIQLFYSRRIGDIRGGTKLLYRHPSWTAAALHAQGENVESSRPGFSVLRLQRSLRGASTLGFVAANRTLGGKESGSAGLDAAYHFTDYYNLTGQIIESYGPFKSGTHAFFLRPSYDTPKAHFHVRYTDLGDRFADNANSMGFIQDDDRRELDSALEYRWNPPSGRVEQVQLSSENNLFWSQAGTLRRYRLNPVVDVEFRNRFSLRSSYWEEYILFEKGFYNRRGSLAVGYNTREWQQVSLGYAVGENFDDFIQIFSARAAHKITDALSAETELTRLLSTPGNEGPSTFIAANRLSYYLTKDLYLKVFYQVNTSTDRHNVQAAFVWRHRPPFGAFQFVYQRGTAVFGERSTQGDTLFAKVSWPLSFRGS